MKINKILALLMAGMTVFSSCESDRDGNPVLDMPESFTLDTPAGNVFDFSTLDNITITCSQPDYGFTAATSYSLEMSLAEDFEKVEVLPTKFTTAKMDVKTNEIATIATKMLMAEGKVKEDFPMQRTIHFRAKAELNPQLKAIYSNAIKIDARLEYTIPPVEIPKKLYIAGDLCGWNWDNTLEMVPVNGAAGHFWRLAFIPENSSIKLSSGSTDATSAGYDKTTCNDNHQAGITNNNGNIGFTKGGWYLLVAKAIIDGGELKYTMDINEPAVYLLGPVTSNVDEEKFAITDEKKFTAPTTADDFFVSPAFKYAVSGDPGVRACVSIDGVDWWKTEFMVLEGKLEYRGNGGDQERVNGAAGQKLYINFTAGTGKIE